MKQSWLWLFLILFAWNFYWMSKKSCRTNLWRQLNEKCVKLKGEKSKKKILHKKWIGISFSESNRNIINQIQMKNGERMFRKNGSNYLCVFFPLFRSLLWNMWLKANYMLLWVYKIVSQNGSQLIRCACDAEWIEGKKAIDTCLHFFFNRARHDDSNNSARVK